MMNAILQRYSVGKSIAERARLVRLWKTLESRVKTPSSTLPGYGKVSLLFMQKMGEPPSDTDIPQGKAPEQTSFVGSIPDRP